MGRNHKKLLAGATLVVVFFLVSGIALAAYPMVTTNHASSVGETSAVLNGAINSNGLYTNAWFEYGASSFPGTMVGLQSVGSYSGTVNISYPLSDLLPQTAYSYRVVAENSSGRNVGNILSFTTGPSSQNQGSTLVMSNSPIPTPSASGGAPLMSTRRATNISQISALLAGSVNPNGEFTSAWFEWGDTRALSNSTAREPLGNGARFLDYSFVLTSLRSGQTYFFRAMAENRFGKREGDVLSFTTAGNQVIINSTPVLTALPPPSVRTSISADIKTKVTVAVSLDPAEPAAGSEANIMVILKNVSSAKVEDVELVVKFPEEIEFLGANAPSQKSETGEVRFLMGPLGPSGEGAINSRLKIKDGLAAGTVLVFNISVSHRNALGAEHLTDTFFVAKVKGSAEFAGAIFGMGFFLWMLPAVIFLFVLLIFYRRFTRKKRKAEEDLVLPAGIKK